jgi:hypothetical protein
MWHCFRFCKEKIWGLQYINLALLLHQNFDVPSEPKMNSLTVLNGNVVVNTENKNFKVKNIENIESWTDAFCNFAKVGIKQKDAYHYILNIHVCICNSCENILF